MPKYKYYCNGLKRSIKPLKVKKTIHGKLNKYIESYLNRYKLSEIIREKFGDRDAILKIVVKQNGMCDKCGVSLFDDVESWKLNEQIVCGGCD